MNRGTKPSAKTIRNAKIEQLMLMLDDYQKSEALNKTVLAMVFREDRVAELFREISQEDLETEGHWIELSKTRKGALVMTQKGIYHLIKEDDEQRDSAGAGSEEDSPTEGES